MVQAIAQSARTSAPRTGQPLLRVTGLTVRFGALHVLDGVDLAVRRGELLALAGENGAGKTTLVRCIAGDLTPSGGRVELGGRRVNVGQASLRHAGIGVVWQNLAQCDNLDVTSNLMLGRERRWVMRSESRRHAAASSLLAELGIPIRDTTSPMQSLSRSQRQLVAIARAVRDRPALLVLDEPTGSLGVSESALVEELVGRLHRAGSTILLVSHDIEQMMRLADRIAVLRRGAVVADVDPATAHPDDIAALVAGQQIDSSARRQLRRLQGLVDQLASTDASSGLPLILTALGSALGAERLCVHLVEQGALRLAGALELPSWQVRALSRLPVGDGGGPAGRAAASGQPVVDVDGSMRRASSWSQAPVGHAWRERPCYAVPVIGSSGVLGVITVFHAEPRAPQRDELDLVALYAGYAAGAVERDRLLGQVTARNRVLETIRVALEALTGPAPLDAGLQLALTALRGALRAASVILLETGAREEVACRARVDGASPPAGEGGDGADGEPVDLAALGAAVLGPTAPQRTSRSIGALAGQHYQAVTFRSPGGPVALVAVWSRGVQPVDDCGDDGLLDDAAQCLRLAFERQEAEHARQQTAALRRSQHLQRQFLSRLSHELRTPLTAIRGYASSLTQPDVTWDGESQRRFVTRIGAESDRLGRLVGDLLDFSAIESGVLRLQPDWCDLPLVLDAARACLPPDAAARVVLSCQLDIGPVWGDHDRLEQVFVNLMDNALRHNPSGTRVWIVAKRESSGAVVTVTDDGVGLPAGALDGPSLSTRRSPTSGSGLGLTITRGIIEAHGGALTDLPVPGGTCLCIRLPDGPATGAADGVLDGAVDVHADPAAERGG